jgi:hypothetical protein
LDPALEFADVILNILRMARRPNDTFTDENLKTAEAKKNF